MIGHAGHLALIYQELHSQLIAVNCHPTISQNAHCSHTTNPNKMLHTPLEDIYIYIYIYLCVCVCVCVSKTIKKVKHKKCPCLQLLGLEQFWHLKVKNKKESPMPLRK